MLSAQARPLIDASVPVLKDHGLSITQEFYRNLFLEHPELQNLFNMGNQANGSQQQSLASAVFAYAANHSNPKALAPVVNRIVHKHVSVGVKPEHYPIVGRHLLGAIQAVLGEAATPALLEAWAEAYGLLADALIEAERTLYRERATRPGALRSLRVVEVEVESEEVRSYRLTPTDGEPLWDFKPGQYISVQVELPSGLHQLRQYSLASSPAEEGLRISVKREPSGPDRPAGQVSRWLHDNLKVGSRLQVSPPSGDFTPDLMAGEPLVLLSAGVGITPMISMLNHLVRVNPARPVVFGHATRDTGKFSHRRDIEAARSRMPGLQVRIFHEKLFPSSDITFRAGLMSVEQLPAWSYTEGLVYLCGPTGFMRSQWEQLLKIGVPVQRLHREVFGPELLDHILS